MTKKLWRISVGLGPSLSLAFEATSVSGKPNANISERSSCFLSFSVSSPPKLMSPNPSSNSRILIMFNVEKCSSCVSPRRPRCWQKLQVLGPRPVHPLRTSSGTLFCICSTLSSSPFCPYWKLVLLFIGDVKSIEYYDGD